MPFHRRGARSAALTVGILAAALAGGGVAQAETVDELLNSHVEHAGALTDQCPAYSAAYCALIPAAKAKVEGGILLVSGNDVGTVHNRLTVFAGATDAQTAVHDPKGVKAQASGFPGMGCNQVTISTVSCLFPGGDGQLSKEIVVHGNQGDDIVSVYDVAGRDTQVTGDAGDDVIRVQNDSPNDEVTCGAGYDTVYADKLDHYGDKDNYGWPIQTRDVVATDCEVVNRS